MHAAGVLHHGDVLDVDLAHQLVGQAVQADLDGAAWLALHIEDRYNANHGIAQRWATAMGTNTNGRCLYAVESGISDEERRDRRLKPIGEVYEQVLTANGATDAPAEPEELEARGLWCDPVDYEAQVARARPATVQQVQRRVPPLAFPAGELYGFMLGYGWTGNAYTVGRNNAVVRPMGKTSVGVSNHLDLRTNPAGWISGPNLGIEVAPWQNDKTAISVEAHGSMIWTFKNHRFGPSVCDGNTCGIADQLGMATLHLSQRIGPGRLNLSGGLRHGFSARGLDGAPVSGTEVKPELGYDYHLSDQTVLVATARLVVPLYEGQVWPAGSLLVAHSLHDFGFSTGIVVQHFDPTVVSSLANLPTQNLGPGIYPLPALNAWARF